MATLNGGTAKKGGCLEVCAEEEEADLGGTHVIYTEMKTLGFVWHIFVFIISGNQSSEKSVSELKPRLSIWIMSLNEAFCVDYLMIYSNVAVTLDYAEEKNNTGCVQVAFLIQGLSFMIYYSNIANLKSK